MVTRRLRRSRYTIILKPSSPNDRYGSKAAAHQVKSSWGPATLTMTNINLGDGQPSEADIHTLIQGASR